MDLARQFGLPDDLITTDEAAALIGMSKGTICSWTRSGRVRGWRLGPRTVVSKAELIEAAKPVLIAPEPVVRTAAQQARDSAAASAELERRGYKSHKAD